MVINRKNVPKIQQNICCISTNFSTYVSTKKHIDFYTKICYNQSYNQNKESRKYFSAKG